MLSRFSVKHPYIVVVAVVISLLLGGVSLSKIQTDLLPEMDIPYLAVIVTDPGSSAQKIEAEITDVVESALSTVNGVQSVSSTSQNNAATIYVEFADGTDMDSAMVKVSSALNKVQSLLPETAGAPNILELGMNMMATMYVAVTYDDKNIYQLTDVAQDTVAERLQRVDGVADVAITGAVEQTVEVRLNDNKIEQVNNKMLAKANSSLAEAYDKIVEGEQKLKDSEKELNDSEEELNNSEAELENSKEKLEQQKEAVSAQQLAQIEQLSTGIAALTAKIAALGANATPADIAELAALENAGMSASIGYGTGNAQMASALSALDSAKKQLESGREQIKKGRDQLKDSKKQLDDSRKTYEESREQALLAANVDSLVDKASLAQLIGAQDFSMPAGYIKNNATDTEQWLLKVGDNLQSVEAVQNLMLTYIEDVGGIRVSDVADVTLVDNEGDSYMSLNGGPGLLVSIYKASTASTSDVANKCKALLPQIMEDVPGLHLTVLEDQGIYIDQFIKSILTSLLLGALLAVIVLALFLRDWKPTVIVAFSIPFSVMLALLLLYFSGITLNTMSLSGLALAIGMLVDNSVVVLENIYRLRGRGIEPARAAVQGAKQMAAPVVASTLTTICVFLPLIFTTGLVNQLAMPFALSLTYVLAASLLVALTLVPCVSRYAFKNYRERRQPLFDKVRDTYARTLTYFLQHKVLPLGISVVLVIVSCVGVLNMGIVMMPNMASDTVEMRYNLPKDISKEEAFSTVDKLMDAVMKVDGVGTLAAADMGAMVSVLSAGAGTEVWDRYILYARMDSKVTTETRAAQVLDEIRKVTKDFPGELTVASSSAADMSAVSSGLSIELAGSDHNKLVEISQDVMNVVKSIPGYIEVENGMEDADKELHLVINEDALTEKGWTVAQLYQHLAGQLKDQSTTNPVDIDGNSVKVSIVTNDTINAQNILNQTVKIKNTSGDIQVVKLSDVATIEEGIAANSVTHKDQRNTLTITAEVEEGYNNVLLSRELQEKLDAFNMPQGYSLTFGGELESVQSMIEQMLLLLIVGIILIYLVMLAQFQSFLSPFIVLMTVPLAFTGGFFALLFAGEQLSMMALIGFAVLMGTIVNNGIVYVDYVNQLRLGGVPKRDALVASGRTRMRPILMTALTTILAMLPMVFSDEIGAGMQRGMALVVAGGMTYATFMTLFVVPILYDIMYRKTPTMVDLGDESIDDDPGDAQAYLEEMSRQCGSRTDDADDKSRKGSDKSKRTGCERDDSRSVHYGDDRDGSESKRTNVRTRLEERIKKSFTKGDRRSSHTRARHTSPTRRRSDI